MMSIPVISEAAAMAAALVDAAALIEEAGVSGLTVTCYGDRVRILVGASAGDARQRAAVVAALGGLAGGTLVEVTTPLAVRAAPGGTLAAGPDGGRAVIAAGQQPPPGWRWVTELDDDPAGWQEAG